MTRIFVALVLLLSMACATAAPSPPVSAFEAYKIRCQSLEAQYQVWGGIGTAMKAISAGGVLTVPLPEHDRDKYVVAISSAAVIALGAAADFVAGDVLDIYNMECPATDTSTVAE